MSAWATPCRAESQAFPPVTQFSEPVFLSALSDVPLMPGFEEMEADLTLFDKPGGRIVEAYALGPRVSASDVSHYYVTILPRFGWGLSTPGVFVRHTERVAIETAQAKGRTLIRYTLSPLSSGDVPSP